MTKPSDFIFNSDYLALAENNKQTFNVSVPSMSYTQSQGYDSNTLWHTDLTTNPAETGSIDEFYISVAGQTFFGDTISSTSLAPSAPIQYIDPRWYMEVDRINNTKIRVSFYFIPKYQVHGTVTNAISATIKLVSFKPPNVF